MSSKGTAESVSNESEPAKFSAMSFRMAWVERLDLRRVRFVSIEGFKRLEHLGAADGDLPLGSAFITQQGSPGWIGLYMSVLPMRSSNI